MRRRSTLVFFLTILTVLVARGQNPDITPTGYSFALPDHPGHLHFDAPAFNITEASAKPSGSEFGLRGDDKVSGIHLLAFLFLLPEEAPLTSGKCRTAILSHEKPNDPAYLTLEHPGIPIALAQYTTGDISTVRAFIAQGDLCGDIAFTAKLPLNPSTPQVKAILQSITFDPDATATFPELFEYATVLFEHNDPSHAAPVYRKALAVLPFNESNHKWLRVTTDQAAMSYGMAGDLPQSRALAESAIKQDPDYPINYYNLACADAESGNAAAARTHLEQAFARKANLIPGENMPNPITDDSILKLKSDPTFWAFVHTLK